jgi:hypothetical protein
MAKAVVQEGLLLLPADVDDAANFHGFWIEQLFSIQEEDLSGEWYPCFHLPTCNGIRM